MIRLGIVGHWSSYQIRRERKNVHIQNQQRKKINCKISELVENFNIVCTKNHQLTKLKGSKIHWGKVKYTPSSQNYEGKHSEKIQLTILYGPSKSQTSMQTGMFNYKNKGGILCEESFCSVSDYLIHDASRNCWWYNGN